MKFNILISFFIFTLLSSYNLYAAVTVSVMETSPEDPIYVNDAASIDVNFLFTSSGEAKTYYLKVGGGGSADADGGTITSASISGYTGSVDETFTIEKLNSVDPSPGDGIKTIYLIVEADEAIVTDGDTDDDDDIYITRGLELNTSSNMESGYATISIHLDNEPPAQMTLADDAVTGGDQRILIRWEEPVDSGEDATISYDLMVQSYDDNGAEYSNSFEEIDDTSYSVEGLVNDTVYSVQIRIRDAAGNTGDWSNVVTGSPQEVDDLWKYYKKNGGQESGGFCFVATAAYGSYDHPAVKLLRKFRDRILMKTAMGRKFVMLYYDISPPLAKFISQSDFLRDFSMFLLIPLLVFAYLLLHFTMLAEVLLSFGGIATVATLLYVKRRRI